MTREQILAGLTARGLPVGSEADRNALRSSGGRSDFNLHPHGHLGYIEEAKPLKPAGVLVPVVNRLAGPTILLTQRTAYLKKHASQISFPGGGWEKQDPHLEATALRETAMWKSWGNSAFMKPLRLTVSLRWSAGSSPPST